MKPISLPWRRFALLTTFLFSPAIAHAQQTPGTPPPSEDAPEVVTVLGRYIPEPQQESTAVANFLSADDLARQGDSNAAAALTRLTGLSVVSGRFVYVRGLGDRYSSALLNGSPLPSPEPLRRQVPLDLFPSNILDGATVQKTFSPNYPGEFGGGIIDLKTLSDPKEPFFTFKLGAGGNTESTDKRAPVYFGNGDTDALGFDDGLRAIPKPLSAAIATHKRVVRGNFTDAQLEQIGESLVNTPLTLIQSEHLQPDYEGELTAGTSVPIGGAMLGFVGVAGYDSQQRLQQAHRIEIQGGLVTKDEQVRTSNWDVVFNTLGSTSLEWGENKIALTGLFVRSSTKKAQLNEDSKAAGRPGTPLGLHSEATAWYERELTSWQLTGSHKPFDNFAFDWRGAFAESTRDAPYERDVTYVRETTGLAYALNQSVDNETNFSDLMDQVASGGFDAKYTIPFNDAQSAIISAGADYSNTVREFNQRQFVFAADSGTQTLTAGCETPDNPATACSLQARVDYLFSPDNIRSTGWVITENTLPDGSYKARLSRWAGYAMVDIDVLPLVHVNVGARYEDAAEGVRTFNSFNQPPRAAPIKINETYWLPSATLTWNFAEDLQVRFAYSQTIARPQFRELAFAAYKDPDTDRVYRGNPYLSDSKFDNFDTRLEYYFGRNQFVTLSGFYKKIDKPIEEVVAVSGGNIFTQFVNAPEATLYGAEAEYRTKFDSPFDIPGIEGEQFIFGVNYTYTHSEVSNQGDVVNVTVLPDLVLTPASTLGVIDGSPLQGTPENIANMEIGFESNASQLTMLVGWVDERIARRGLATIPTVIENPGVNLDLVFRHDFMFGRNTVTLGLSGRNLLDSSHEEYQDVNGRRFDANTYDRGRTFSASLTAKF